MSVVIITIVLILCCAAIEELCANAVAVVAIQVRPRIMITRGDVTVTVRVPAHEANRLLIVAWGSNDPSGQAGSTRKPIDGEDGPTLFSVSLPNVTPANYKFLATVLDAAGKVRGYDEAFITTPEVQ